MTPPARLRTVAVILAGGTGSRVGLDIPKQLLKIAGKTILEHTLDAFESHPDIDEILVMMATGHTEEAQRLVSQGGTARSGGCSRAAPSAATRPAPRSRCWAPASWRRTASCCSTMPSA